MIERDTGLALDVSSAQFFCVHFSPVRGVARTLGSTLTGEAPEVDAAG
jgi:hypothetical protein